MISSVVGGNEGLKKDLENRMRQHCSVSRRRVLCSTSPNELHK